MDIFGQRVERGVNGFLSIFCCETENLAHDINIREKPRRPQCAPLVSQWLSIKMRANYHVLHRIFLFCFFDMPPPSTPVPLLRAYCVSVDQFAHALRVPFITLAENATPAYAIYF